MQGQPVDSICGRVKVKKASGESISDRPFLYLVKEDKAFIDDGYPEFSRGNLVSRRLHQPGFAADRIPASNRANETTECRQPSTYVLSLLRARPGKLATCERGHLVSVF